MESTIFPKELLIVDPLAITNQTLFFLNEAESAKKTRRNCNKRILRLLLYKITTTTMLQNENPITKMSIHEKVRKSAPNEFDPCFCVQLLTIQSNYEQRRKFSYLLRNTCPSVSQR